MSRKVDLLQLVKCKVGKHKWQDWSINAMCIKRRVCYYCGIQQDAQASHNWSNWERDNLHLCKDYRVCQRCGIQEFNVSHDWIDSGGGEVTVWTCRRCGRVEEETDYDCINRVAYSYGYGSGGHGVVRRIIRLGEGQSE